MVGASIFPLPGEAGSIAGFAVRISYIRAQLDELREIGLVHLERGGYRVTDIARYSTHQLRAPPVRVTVVPRSPAGFAVAVSVVEEDRFGVLWGSI